MIPNKGRMSIHIRLGAAANLRKAVLKIKREGQECELTGINHKLGERRCSAGLTKLRFRWKELNFLVRKYFGKIVAENSATSAIRNAFPD